MNFMMSGNRSLGVLPKKIKLNNKKKISAFYLANKGYDVWMANQRGISYSPGHDYLNMKDPKYWDFRFLIFPLINKLISFFLVFTNPLWPIYL